MWQDVGVVLVVGGAIYYLARKFFARPAPRTTTSFVALSSSLLALVLASVGRAQAPVPAAPTRPALAPLQPPRKP